MQEPDELDNAGLFRKPHTFRPPNQPREIVPNSEAIPVYFPKKLLLIGLISSALWGLVIYAFYLLLGAL